MSYTQATTIKRIPTGRPLTPKEHDENLEAIDTTNTRIQAEFDLRTPVGVINLWSGSSAAIPTGWVLCNGGTYNGQQTPDLRARFVVGAGSGSGYTDGQTGGSDAIGNHAHTNPNTNAHPLVVSEIPPHTHQLASNIASGGNEIGSKNPNAERFALTTSTTDDGSSSGLAGQGHVHAQGNTGGAGAHDNRPKFYALAYIMFVDFTQPA